MKNSQLFLLGALLLLHPVPTVAQTSSVSVSNLEPRYGGGKKSRALQKVDAQFIEDCAHRFPSRQTAAAYFVAKGWEFFKSGDYNTAIKRFNQGWLLDSTNAGAYWGFGAVTGRRQQYDASLRFFQVSQRFDPSNKRILLDIAQTLLIRYDSSPVKQVADLDLAVSNIQSFLAEAANSPVTSEAYIKLATAYFLRHDYTASWQYVDKATVLNPTLVQNWGLLPDLQKAAPR